MICRTLRFLPAVLGMAIDIAIQMRRHNQMIAAAEAKRAEAERNSHSK